MFRSLRIFVAWMLTALMTCDAGMACRWSCCTPCRPVRCYVTYAAPPISDCHPSGPSVVRQRSAPSAPPDTAPEPYTTRQPVIDQPPADLPEPSVPADELPLPETVETQPETTEPEAPSVADVPPPDTADVAADRPAEPAPPAAEDDAVEPPLPAATADQPPAIALPEQPAPPQETVDTPELAQPEVADTPQPSAPEAADAPDEPAPDDASQPPAEPEDDLLDSLLEPAPAADDPGDLFGEPPAAEPTPDAPAEQLPATEDPAAEQPAAEEPAPDDFDSLFDESTRRAPEPSPEGRLAAHAVRHWVDNTGQYACDGRLLRIMDGKVRILKANGRTATVPLERLSRADLRYVARAGAPRVGGPVARADAVPKH